MRSLVAGSRGSALALWQTHYIAGLLQTPVRIEVITTRGDVDMRERLQGKLEKGFFTKELEDALLDRRVDFAVHSLKDLPTKDPRGLAVIATPPRAPVHDLLVSRDETIAKGARVGASSLRRQALVTAFVPGAAAVPLRGNVPTRIERLRKGDYDAIVIARAGVERLALDLSGLTVRALDPKRWVPAPGQGAVAVQARTDDDELRTLATKADHTATAAATRWERAFLAVLEGGCTTPFGCYVEESLQKAWLGMDHQGTWRSLAVTLPSPTPDERFMTDALQRLERTSNSIDTEVDSNEPLFQTIR